MRISANQEFPASQDSWRHHPGPQAIVRATGEFREPKAGEWFLSGAIVEGYYAPNDLSTKYHIAEPVK